MLVPGLVWLLFIFLILIGLKYQISWDANGITQKAAGLSERRISYEDIASVKIERAEVGEFVAMSRPFRRIAIYGRSNDPASRIDVSLRHFRDGDILALLDEIRSLRPDLMTPEVDRICKLLSRSG